MNCFRSRGRLWLMTEYQVVHHAICLFFFFVFALLLGVKRVSDFVERCVEWSAGSKQRPTSGRSANLRELEAAAEQRKSVLTKKALKDFFEKEKANESKLPCEDYVDENVCIFSALLLFDISRLRITFFFPRDSCTPTKSLIGLTSYHLLQAFQKLQIWLQSFVSSCILFQRMFFRV